MKNFFLIKWIKNVSIAKKLYFVVGIMALLIALELFMLVFMIHTLSSTRAYVGAEGLWSKAEKDAVYSLRKYGHTYNEKDYQHFLYLLKVPLGDRKTRLELRKKNPDLTVAYQGFLEGRVHPDDIDGAIRLFTRFHDVYYIHKAIAIWTEGDSLIGELQKLGAELDANISSDTVSMEKVDQTLDEIDTLNDKLTVLEDDFSFTLGEGSRWLENLILKILFSIALTVEFTGLFLTISVSIGISKGIDEIIRIATKVAKSDFNNRAKVFSKDEIGVLATSFNQMTDNLQQKINEQNRTEQALRAQKGLYETLLKVQSEMGEGVAITEGQKIVYANEALCKIYGYSLQEILDMPSFIDIVVQEEREQLIERLKQRLSGQSMSDAGETAVIRKDGKIINIEYSSKMIKAEDRTQLVSIIRDITERKKTESEIKQKTEDIARSNKELEQFAYVASHDLQEPLRTIISYLQLLEKRYKNKLDTKADEFINFAVDGSKRMYTLINDLLAYSRIQTTGLTFEKIDCAKIMDIVLDNLQNTIAKSKAKISFDTELPVIKADKVQMVQLFQNLIDNSIKYKSTKAPKIRITAEKKGNVWLFSLTDNGIGIAKEYAERIFVIFQRLHTREKYEGTGIGLSVCKKIVEHHGGKIWVESELGKGSTFYFTI